MWRKHYQIVLEGKGHTHKPKENIKEKNKQNKQTNQKN